MYCFCFVFPCLSSGWRRPHSGAPVKTCAIVRSLPPQARLPAQLRAQQPPAAGGGAGRNSKPSSHSDALSDPRAREREVACLSREALGRRSQRICRVAMRCAVDQESERERGVGVVDAPRAPSLLAMRPCDAIVSSRRLWCRLVARCLRIRRTSSSSRRSTWRTF